MELELVGPTEGRHHHASSKPRYEVSTALIPGISDTAAAVRQIAGEICRVDPAIPWHLLRFTPELRMQSAPPTSPAALGQAVAAGREVGLHFVYVERALGASGRATRCPHCGHEVVSREVGGTRRVELVGGACPRCGAVLPGRWRGVGS